MKRRQHVITILILGALATISPFSIDMYLPGFPAIAQDLETSIAHVQLSLTSYLVGIAAGQLLYGPLLDRFGRKNPLYVGLVVYVLASIACAFINSADALIALRFFQALGGCAGIVAAQALVRDLYPLNQIAQAFSSLTLVIAVSPMIAPTVGGYVTAVFGWHYVFVILAAITAVILVVVYFVLPEGRHPDPTISLKPKAVVKNFYKVITQPQFLVYGFSGGVATSATFAYIAGSPEVMISIYGFNEREYGWIFAFLAFGLIGSTQLNHIFLKQADIVLAFPSAIGFLANRRNLGRRHNGCPQEKAGGSRRAPASVGRQALCLRMPSVLGYDIAIRARFGLVRQAASGLPKVIRLPIM